MPVSGHSAASIAGDLSWVRGAVPVVGGLRTRKRGKASSGSLVDGAALRDREISHKRHHSKILAFAWFDTYILEFQM
jgi:hypothetical protein